MLDLNFANNANPDAASSSWSSPGTGDGSKISGKGFKCLKGGVRFADIITFFFNIP